MSARAFALLLSLAMSGCGESDGPASPTGSTTATVRLVFMGSTTRRADLPASAQACVNGVGSTHTHPSWRAFATIPLQAVPPDRYEITFSDVPANTRVSFRVNDQNACDENPTGAVTRNVFVNEPGFAFTVASNGTISQHEAISVWGYEPLQLLEPVLDDDDLRRRALIGGPLDHEETLAVD